MSNVLQGIPLKEMMEAYPLEGELAAFTEVGSGHINNTYRLDLKDGQGACRSYLLQELNTVVFRDSVGLMRNLVGITNHLREKLQENGGDPARECMTLIRTRDGASYHIDENGRFWRLFTYIDNSYSVQETEDPAILTEAGRAFGRFQRLLADYPIGDLVDTIPYFHDTGKRFETFREVLEKDELHRADSCRPEIDFLLAREKDCSVLTDLLAAGRLPLRVTHNDTKLNNLLFDEKDGRAVCVVDLDTVMPGLALYDFGDSIRSCAGTAEEDCQDLSQMHFSFDKYRAFTKGFLAEAGSALTQTELDYLPFSAKLITMECGMRFLTDYLAGDVYFKIAYPGHNLVRCRTQFKLAEEMEAAMPAMRDEVKRILNALPVSVQA